MTRTLIDRIPLELPLEIERFISGARVYDSSSSPEARVYFIDKGEGYFLKSAGRAALGNEARMDRYFHTKELGAEVLSYTSGECDLLLTSRLAGDDCTHEIYLSEPKRLCDRLAEELRRLHELDFDSCPIKNRTAEYLELAKENYRTGNYDKSHFPDSFGYRTADEAFAVLTESASGLRSDVLVHGDFCLPNVILNGWQLSGFIDLGNGGIGDRHIDLFWGAWTLLFNLKTDKYRERFFDAYGRDKIDTEMLKTVAAAEVFG